ncbi:MAG: hypothetical protein JSV17_11945, partial [Candidatus Aminicenantes bacterium]
RVMNTSPIVLDFSLLICLILFFVFRKTKKLLEEMWAVDTYTAKDLRLLVKHRFDATVEVEGQVSCDDPVISLAARIPCCYAHTTVSRQERKTRTVTGRGSDGRSHSREETYYDWTIDLNETSSAIFKIQDKTGYTLVDPTDARIDLETVYDEQISHREPWFESSVSFSDTGLYKIHERAFLPKDFAYVLGRATSTEEGQALILAPEKGYMDPKKKFFVISRKSEKELTRSKQKKARWLFWLSAVFFSIALYCLFAYLK